MRPMLILAVLAMTLFGVSTARTSAHGAGDTAAAPAAVTNKSCPIMGSESSVDPKIRLEHEGQYVYFCCDGCLNMFKKDPATWISKMSPEEQSAIKANDTCPMSGEKIANRTVRSEAGGKLVYFCCDGCKTAFDKKNAGS